jgi:hypothetical protein
MTPVTSPPPVQSRISKQAHEANAPSSVVDSQVPVNDFASKLPNGGAELWASAAAGSAENANPMKRHELAVYPRWRILTT